MFKANRPEPDPLGDIYALYEDPETLTRLCIKELWNALIQKNFGTRYVETLIAADRLPSTLKTRSQTQRRLLTGCAKIIQNSAITKRSAGASTADALTG